MVTISKFIAWVKRLDWLLIFVLAAVIITSLRQAIGTGEAAYKLSGDIVRSYLSGATSDVLWLACLAMVWRHGVSFWSQLTVICAILISFVGNFYIDAQVTGSFNVAGWQLSSSLIIIALDVLPTLAAFSIFETLIHSRRIKVDKVEAAKVEPVIKEEQPIWTYQGPTRLKPLGRPKGSKNKYLKKEAK